MICPYCKDHWGERSEVRQACPECLAEIRDGTIPPPEKITHREHGGNYGPHDDTSPGWENAIRDLEDG